jgi:Fe-S-cluster-containing hydrogenase component 2
VTLCLECVRHCAAGAMSPASGAIVIDKKKCISCFCCQEMCPAGAITVRSGPLARLLRLGR